MFYYMKIESSFLDVLSKHEYGSEQFKYCQNIIYSVVKQLNQRSWIVETDKLLRSINNLQRSSKITREIKRIIENHAQKKIKPRKNEIIYHISWDEQNDHTIQVLNLCNKNTYFDMLYRNGFLFDLNSHSFKSKIRELFGPLVMHTRKVEIIDPQLLAQIQDNTFKRGLTKFLNMYNELCQLDNKEITFILRGSNAMYKEPGSDERAIFDNWKTLLNILSKFKKDFKIIIKPYYRITHQRYWRFNKNITVSVDYGLSMLGDEDTKPKLVRFGYLHVKDGKRLFEEYKYEKLYAYYEKRGIRETVLGDT